MANFLKSELAYEKEATKPMPAAPKGFTVIDKPGDMEVKLTRQFKDETYAFSPLFAITR